MLGTSLQESRKFCYYEIPCDNRLLSKIGLTIDCGVINAGVEFAKVGPRSRLVKALRELDAAVLLVTALRDAASLTAAAH